jgi:hypothetical protein
MKLTAAGDEAYSRGDLPRSQYVLGQNGDANWSLTVEGDLERYPSENIMTVNVRWVGIPALARSENTDQWIPVGPD